MKGYCSYGYPRFLIGIILAVTIYVVVVTRQKYMRHLKGRPLSRSRILFPRVSYRDANRGVSDCVKYIFNYGFYRFGIEVSVISCHIRPYAHI